MLDRANDQESLGDWADRNGIELGDGDAGVVGYWCRVAGVPLADEQIRRDFTVVQIWAAKRGWRLADNEIRAEVTNETGKEAQGVQGVRFADAEAGQAASQGGETQAEKI
jgi:hypothetical protein